MLRLQAGQSSVVVAPEIGGALVGWQFGALPVLRRAVPEALLHHQVRGLAGFPLVPFGNRIAYGRFQWQGRDYQLDRNFGDHPHTIHGVGWQSEWTVEQAADTALVLSLAHRPVGDKARRWPFAFDSTLRFTLEEDALHVHLQVVNRHPGTAPAGLGLHPYFPRSSYSMLQFRAEGVWLSGDDSLPSRHVSIPAEWDHSLGCSVGSVALDHCFTGWDGIARLNGKGLRLHLHGATETRFLQVYTPEGQDFFCVEPVTHMPDAINQPEQPMRVLAPGEAMEIGIRLEIAEA